MYRGRDKNGPKGIAIPIFILLSTTERLDLQLHVTAALLVLA